MVKPFDDVVFRMQAGKISEVVETGYGYHIIKLEEVRDAQLPGFDEVKAQIAESLQQRKLQQFQQDLKKKAKIQ